MSNYVSPMNKLHRKIDVKYNVQPIQRKQEYSSHARKILLLQSSLQSASSGLECPWSKNQKLKSNEVKDIDWYKTQLGRIKK